MRPSDLDGDLDIGSFGSKTGPLVIRQAGNLPDDFQLSVPFRSRDMGTYMGWKDGRTASVS